MWQRKTIEKVIMFFGMLEREREKEKTVNNKIIITFKTLYILIVFFYQQTFTFPFVFVSFFLFVQQSLFVW